MELECNILFHGSWSYIKIIHIYYVYALLTLGVAFAPFAYGGTSCVKFVSTAVHI